MSSSVNTCEQEARVFFNYLLKSNSPPDLVSLYCKACAHYAFDINAKDERILKYVLKNPATISCIDAALGFSGKNSVLRKKLHLFFSIAETHKDLSDKFIISKKTKISFLKMAFTGIASLFKILTGNIILLFI